MPEENTISPATPETEQTPAPVTDSMAVNSSVFESPETATDLRFLFDESDVPTAGEIQRIARKNLLDSVGATEDKPAREVPETPVAKEEEKPTEAENKILGRFKTQADLEKSYTELEKEFTKRSQRIAEIEKAVGNSDPKFLAQALQDHLWVQNTYKPQWEAAQKEKGGPPKEEAPKPETYQGMDRETLLDRFSEDPYGTLVKIAQEAMLSNPKMVQEALKKEPSFAEEFVPELREMRALDKVSNEFNELTTAQPELQDEAFRNQVLPVMKEIYDADPSLVQLPMKVGYMMAKGKLFDTLKQQSSEAILNAAKMATEKAYQNQDMKKQAVVDGALAIEPGSAAPRDAHDEWYEWAMNQRVQV